MARRRWFRVLVAAVVLVVVGAEIAAHVNLGYYAVRPGRAQPVAPLIKVPSRPAPHQHGGVLLTDVYLTPVSALGYLFDKLTGDTQLVPTGTVLQPGMPASELYVQGYLQMAQSQEAAKVAAFQALGRRVSARDGGAMISTVLSRTPAARVLSVGQIVTAVDGRATPDACTFAKALASHRAGQAVRLSVEQSHVTAKAVVVPGPTVTRTVTLAPWPASLGRPGGPGQCPVSNARNRGYLGVAAQTQLDYRLPVTVSIDTTKIGGPSAGLAMTLGIIDRLSGGDLTGGRTVAATGTITPGGAVGEVGGVPQKTVAVERAGATVFFVPAAQVATARAKAVPGLHVYGVRTLAQALADLRRLGGTVPAVARPGS